MGTLLKLAAIATIGGLFVAILAQLVEFPKLRFAVEDPGPTQTAPLQDAPSAHAPREEAPSSRRQKMGPTDPEANRVEAPLQQNQPNPEGRSRSAETSRSPREPASPTLPVEFTLDDGEQEVFLGGRAAAAIEFSRVGEMELATLRIHTDGSTKNHALLGPGGRFEFTAGGETYSLSVLRLDTNTGQVVLRVDSSSP